VHHFSADSVRDVTVSVGHYDLAEQEVDGVRVHLGTPSSGTRATPEQWLEQLSHAIKTLGQRFGSFPYSDLWASITPGQSDGTEYPSALQFGDEKRSDLHELVAHEVSHQWFYSLVGNNQAEDPWMDEALATVGESIAGGNADYYRDYEVPSEVVGHMGEPMTYWVDHGEDRSYTDGVYNQGAHVLLRARDQVGADRFDAALRSYVQTNAHRVARPTDFAQAFAGYPDVLLSLREAGALPKTQ
jgi:Peptidase family M1 domain